VTSIVSGLCMLVHNVAGTTSGEIVHIAGSVTIYQSVSFVYAYLHDGCVSAGSPLRPENNPFELYSKIVSKDVLLKSRPDRNHQGFSLDRPPKKW
jgi:hypothetical protein